MWVNRLLIKLAYCVGLFFSSSHIYSIEPLQIDEQLKKAESVRTAENEIFLGILSSLESEVPNFSIKQKYYFSYLKGFDSFKKGLIDEAINIYLNVEENSNDIELSFKASILLANLYSLKKDWLNGFKSLDKLSTEYNNIQNHELRLKSLTVSASFYNELEQFETTKTFTNRILKETSDKRTRCVAFGLKFKADLSTENSSDLENEIIKGIGLCTEANELIIVNIIRTYLASYYLERNRYQESIDLLEKHINEINQTGYQLLINETKRLLAESYLNRDDLVKAKFYALEVVSNKRAEAYLKAMLSAYKVLAVVAKRDGDYNAAFNYQDKYIKSKESLYEQTKAKQQAVESEKYQATERDNQIALLSKQKEITELELSGQKQKQFVWGATFISITLLIFFWFYRKTTQKELTRQKQVNWELQELDKLKDRILTNTSHELRTPLNGIIGLSELIVLEYENEVEDELIKSIRLIGQSGTRLALIVNDILDLAQLKSGKIRFSMQEFDLVNLIKEVIVLCQPLIKTNLVKIAFLEKDENIIISQDKHRIQQVLFNLIGNAIKFTDEGSISVHCEKHNEDFLIEIKDTGIGIPFDKVHRIFEGFEQVDNGNSRRNQGSGIGLAICREIVTALGGEISIQSKINKGSTVSFKLPLIKK